MTKGGIGGLEDGENMPKGAYVKIRGAKNVGIGEVGGAAYIGACIFPFLREWAR